MSSLRIRSVITGVAYLLFVAYMTGGITQMIGQPRTDCRPADEWTVIFGLTFLLLPFALGLFLASAWHKAGDQS